MAKVLLVDDDRKTVELIKLYLENDGFEVAYAFDGHRALNLARDECPDLVLLDLMLPKVDGIEVCRRLRLESKVPIIMLTARTTEDDKLDGLNLGADDYITKPFSPREVLARVKAVLRRTGDAPDKRRLQFATLTLDMTRHEARLGDEPLILTPKEFKLLEIFTLNPGRAFTRRELLQSAFGPDYEGLERTIDVHIMNLRKKVETPAAPAIEIQTVYGVGYKLVEAKSVPQSAA